MSKIETEYKLFTAEVACPFYYGSKDTQVINIVAKDLEEALLIAQTFVEEKHRSLKLINNDCESIYMLNELDGA